MLEVFWICFIIIAIILFLRFAGPNVILIIAIIVGLAMYKACKDMEKEEQHRKEFNERMRKSLEKEMREWQEAHGVYKEKVFD